jgi:2-polyprenyl-3-methyl-5-hydroxy-6-metoxy-1,4-benzoquinol methylase
MKELRKITGFPCKVCGDDALEEFEGFGELCRVTSDCKPFAAGGRLAICCSCGVVQKPSDEKWLAEIDEIYSEYAAYYQSDGVEQAVFDPVNGEANTRSAAILEKLAEVYAPPKSGDILDVGCGNGVLLTAFSNIFPDWRLNGHDLSDIALDKLSAIPGFKKLFNEPLSEIETTFDMVSMIHSLEHFPDPVQGLVDIKPLIVEGGCLLVQVPNAEISPFDFLVADHASHFSPSDFPQMLAKAGFASTIISDQWVTKEISVVAKPGTVEKVPNKSAEEIETTKQYVRKQIDWLLAVVKESKAAAAEGRAFGVFGTSIAAMWMYGQLGDSVSFFVDEDKSRQGTMLHGKPVYHPQDVAADTIVYTGLIPHVARAVASRMSEYGFDMRVPPELADV